MGAQGPSGVMAQDGAESPVGRALVSPLPGEGAGQARRACWSHRGHRGHLPSPLSEVLLTLLGHSISPFRGLPRVPRAPRGPSQSPRSACHHQALSRAGPTQLRQDEVTGLRSPPRGLSRGA